ncbi:MAG TPA: aldo/keto reductase [Conexibacter sp.]
MTTNARGAGTFKIGGDLEVTRLGFGAMRIVGPGIWDEPADHDEVVRVLRRLPEIGVDFIDTADSYGPDISEQLIREALHPYGAGTIVATKGGFTRQGPDLWEPVGRPEYLRQCVLLSLRRLGVERIDLYQLHRIDPTVAREEQFEALKAFQDEGLVRHIGLSEVSVEEIEAARRFFAVTTVQNRYNLADRASQDVVDYCDREGIGFIPWFPLAAGALAEPGGVAAEIAAAHDATPGQVALAWLLHLTPVMLPIPGTSSVDHLEQNVAAAGLSLSEDEVARLTAAA